MIDTLQALLRTRMDDDALAVLDLDPASTTRFTHTATVK